MAGRGYNWPVIVTMGEEEMKWIWDPGVHGEIFTAPYGWYDTPVFIYSITTYSYNSRFLYYNREHTVNTQQITGGTDASKILHFYIYAAIDCKFNSTHFTVKLQ